MLDKDLEMTKTGFTGALQRYLAGTLHARIRLKPFDATSSLPSFLEKSYGFYETRIAGRRCILLAAAATGTPSDIVKHTALMRTAVNDAVVVFATPSLNAHNRSRLLAQGVAFVVPGNQLYIPELAMDLREHFRAPRLRTADDLLPAAQAVLFLHLLGRDDGATTPSDIAERLGYSAMSVGRAFDALAAANLAETEKRGKERHLRFKAEGRELLEDAREVLRNPVRAVKHVRGGRIGRMLKRAGETALAELTDLSRPRIDTYAIAAGEWKATKQTCDFVEGDEDDVELVVETWSYDPAALSDGAVVDPLSLYAQFREHDDQRIAMAADKVLETAFH